MRAAVCSEYGPPEVAHIQVMPAPAMSPTQARVRVSAASVNFPDVLIMANEYQMQVPTPFIPGSEFSGVVVETGDDVGTAASTVKVGDRVVGTVLCGAFAQEVTVEAEMLTPIPDGVDLSIAAAFGVAHRTSYHALRSVARVQPGEELIVLGAGGGVGLAAVQLGSVLGASVTAVASSPAKLDAAAARGATKFVNYREVDLRSALKELLPGGADVVLDPVGGDLAEPALRCLRWGGRFVTVGYASGTIPRIPLNLVLLKGIQVLGFQFLNFAVNAADEMQRNEAELLDLLVSGRAVPHIGATFAFEDVVAALRMVADGRAIGKVMLDLGSQ